MSKGLSPTTKRSQRSWSRAIWDLRLVRCPVGAFAEADDPFVREQAQEQPLAAAAVGLDVVEEEGFDVGDFHGWDLGLV